VADLNRYSLIESALALFLSFLVNLAVVGTFAHFFYTDVCGDAGLACVPLHPGVGPSGIAAVAAAGPLPGVHPPSGNENGGVQGQACVSAGMAGASHGWCDEIGLDQAGDALSAAIGPLGVTVWAVGLLAAGQASTMSTTFAGQGRQSRITMLQQNVNTFRVV